MYNNELYKKWLYADLTLLSSRVRSQRSLEILKSIFEAISEFYTCILCSYIEDNLVHYPTYGPVAIVKYLRMWDVFETPQRRLEVNLLLLSIPDTCNYRDKNGKFSIK